MKKRLLAITAMFMGAGSPAGAITIPGTGLSLTGNATIVSDYRFRGISQSGRKPALQLGLSVAHESGLYAGLWGSTIDLYDDDPATGFDGGKDLEIDALAGWNGKLAPGLTADLSVTYYAYPGVTGPTNYAEALASLEFSLGPVAAKLGGGYFPDQQAVPDDGSYVFAELSGELPASVTLTGHAGRQFYGSGFGPAADYWEWSLDAGRDFGPLSASLSYVDTDLPKGFNAGATIVASLGVSF